MRVKGIGGPGAPHIFRLQRRSNCGYQIVIYLVKLFYVLGRFRKKIGLQLLNCIACCEAFASTGLGPSEIEDKYFRLPLCQQGPNDVILQNLSLNHQLGFEFCLTLIESESLIVVVLQSLDFVELLCWASTVAQHVVLQLSGQNAGCQTHSLRRPSCFIQSAWQWSCYPWAFLQACTLNIEFDVGMFGILLSIWSIVSVWRLSFQAFRSSFYFDAWV